MALITSAAPRKRMEMEVETVMLNLLAVVCEVVVGVVVIMVVVMEMVMNVV